MCRTVTLEGSLLTTTKIPSFEAVWTFYAHFLLLAINGQRCPFHPRCLLIVYPRADAGRSVGICCQPRRLLRLSPPRRPPSWRELASNVHAKFASYLSRDPATRLQGGADGVRQRAQTSVSPPLDLITRVLDLASSSTGPFVNFLPPNPYLCFTARLRPSSLSH